jgi:flagellar motor switch protein FliG
MPNAIREMEIQREIESLSSLERAAVILAEMGPDASNRILSHMTPEDVGYLYLVMGLLPPVSEGARRRILGEFRARLVIEGLGC